MRWALWLGTFFDIQNRLLLLTPKIQIGYWFFHHIKNRLLVSTYVSKQVPVIENLGVQLSVVQVVWTIQNHVTIYDLIAHTGCLAKKQNRLLACVQKMKPVIGFKQPCQTGTGYWQYLKNRFQALVGVPRGAGLLLAGVCGLSSVGGGEGCPAGGSVAGVCWCSGGWGRPVSRGPGVRAMVGMCGSLGEQREGRGMGGDCAVGFVVSVYVSARRGALAWSVVGRAVWRRSLPSSAAAARISQTSLRIWWTSCSLVGRRYASFGLRPTRLRTLWMAWYPQVRGCCALGRGLGRVSGPASICVWAVGMAQIQGTVPVGGQRRWIQWVRQSMASPRW